MIPSLVRFSRGFLCGSLVGAVLFTVGLVAWGIAVITSVDKDNSTHGISLLPVYVLVFGLGGGVVGMFEADKAKSKWIKLLSAWVFAVVIVLAGCFFIASFVISREPVDWVWGVNSGTALLVMLTFALARPTRNKRSNAEPNAADGGRDPGSSRVQALCAAAYEQVLHLSNSRKREYRSSDGRLVAGRRRVELLQDFRTKRAGQESLFVSRPTAWSRRAAAFTHCTG